MRRRVAIERLLAVLGALPLRPLRIWAQSAGFPGRHAPTLKTLAAAVLPASLGREQTDRWAERFAAWVKSYRAGADMDHGYGFTRLRKKPPSPAAAYVTQLDALVRAAEQKGGRLETLPANARRALIEAALEEAKVRELPASPTGQHVVSDLMSYFFHSSEANDLCYRAAIQRDACRGFDQADQPPEAR